ncbi:uncharacterized protein LOC123949119 isoform X2 [Meles meles]|nr:uncharacterized protein LOC123949119 isoform X2 [Meles meles]
MRYPLRHRARHSYPLRAAYIKAGAAPVPGHSPRPRPSSFPDKRWSRCGQEAWVGAALASPRSFWKCLSVLNFTRGRKRSCGSAPRARRCARPRRLQSGRRPHGSAAETAPVWCLWGGAGGRPGSVSARLCACALRTTLLSSLPVPGRGLSSLAPS